MLQVKQVPVGYAGSNCYLVTTQEKNALVVDPGGEIDNIVSEIQQEGLTLRYILLTHAHYDHIGGVNALVEKYHPQVVLGREDEDMALDAHLNLSARGKLVKGFTIQPTVLVQEGDTIALDELRIKVIETPGHTKGGVCYVCEDVIFSGDTLFRGDIGRCDLYGGNLDTMMKSLKKLKDLPGDYKVLPGHSSATTLQREREYNRYMKKV